MAEIDDSTAQTFYEGLSTEYRIQMREEARSHYSDIFAEARVIAKRIDRDRQRIDNEKEARRMATVGRPLAHSTPRRNDYTQYREHRYDNPHGYIELRKKHNPHRKTTIVPDYTKERPRNLS